VDQYSRQQGRLPYTELYPLSTPDGTIPLNHPSLVSVPFCLLLIRHTLGTLVVIRGNLVALVLGHGSCIYWSRSSFMMLMTRT
jgi:hypothetical protein